MKCQRDACRLRLSFVILLFRLELVRRVDGWSHHHHPWPRRAQLTYHRRGTVKIPYHATDRRQLYSQKTSLEQEIAELERQVLASAQAQMDYNQITRALLSTDYDNDSTTITTGTPTWKVALTASTVMAGVAFGLFANLYVSLFVWVSIFFFANADPTQDDSLLGPLARILGRATLQSYQTSKPKMQALARAVVTGQDEVRDLKLQVATLQSQLTEAQDWQRRRLWVEDNLQSFSVEELKQRAREHQLAVGGTKLQLLQRLVDANVMDWE